MEEELLRMESISKTFPGVKALTNVDFSLNFGEIHALVGENGAGKSTLMNVLSGVYPSEEGNIYLNNKKIVSSTPKQAEEFGISMIHQELNLVPHLTIAENIFLGRENTHGKSPFINKKIMNREALKYLDLLNINISPNTLISTLSVGEQQMIEIAKSLSKEAKILILDEPTAALTTPEAELLFEVLNDLREQGVGMIYVSHRMEDIFRISDRVTILRDGHKIGSRNTEDTNTREIVNMMVGREMNEYYPERTYSKEKRKIKFEVKNLNTKDKLKNISFKVHEGEILGISGLMGSGRTEIAKSIFGVDDIQSGDVLIDNKPVSIDTPKDAIDLGIAFVVEDRKTEGLITISSVQNNINLLNMDNISRNTIIDEKKSKSLSDKVIKNFSIRPDNEKVIIENLSGGNQQKVVIGKWLEQNPKVLILDEPTRGVDVGAKREIYDIIVSLANSGVSIILISSDLPEILNLPSRILVMHEGEINGEFTKEEATEEKIMMIATGGKTNE